MTLKQLYKKALSYYITNASDVLIEVYYYNNWKNIIPWGPFKSCSISEIKVYVETLFDDFQEILSSDIQEEEYSYFSLNFFYNVKNRFSTYIEIPSCLLKNIVDTEEVVLNFAIRNSIITKNDAYQLFACKEVNKEIYNQMV